MNIPYENLSPDVLRGIIEEFILREGTDYGQGEFTMEDKVSAVVSQLQRGVIVINFDPEMETCNIVPK